jgi:hypothetical protein
MDPQLASQLAERPQVGQQQLAGSPFAARAPGDDVCHWTAVHSQDDSLAGLDRGDDSPGVVSQLAHRYIHGVAQRSTQAIGGDTDR